VEEHSVITSTKLSERIQEEKPIKVLEDNKPILPELIPEPQPISSNLFTEIEDVSVQLNAERQPTPETKDQPSQTQRFSPQFIPETAQIPLQSSAAQREVPLIIIDNSNSPVFLDETKPTIETQAVPLETIPERQPTSPVFTRPPSPVFIPEEPATIISPQEEPHRAPIFIPESQPALPEFILESQPISPRVAVPSPQYIFENHPETPEFLRNSEPVLQDFSTEIHEFPANQDSVRSLDSFPPSLNPQSNFIPKATIEIVPRPEILDPNQIAPRVSGKCFRFDCLSSPSHPCCAPHQTQKRQTLPEEFSVYSEFPNQHIENIEPFMLQHPGLITATVTRVEKSVNW
jgi:hypothetical protein